MDRIPFEKAIEALRAKIPRDTTNLEADINQRAEFVVKRMAGDLLKDVKALTVQAIEQGIPQKDFIKDFTELVGKKGWVATPDGNAWRAKLIYNNQLRGAYAQGRKAVQFDPLQLAKRPYGQWLHSDANDPREWHKALDGWVFPLNDPRIQAIYPPCGHNCGCQVVTLSQRDIESEGYKVRPIPGEIGGQVVAPDKGWS
jgi:SPP1 gp7 family putative phage head morphogenesis protein